MKKEHDKIARRLTDIIQRLNDREKLTIEQLCEDFNVNKRTIQRDLHERLGFLPIVKENGYYSLESYALGKLSTKDIQNFATLSGISSLYPSLDQRFISDILNIKLSDSYLVKNQGFEDISCNRNLFEQISGAIARKCPIHFSYNDKPRSANPYKLINNNGIWYLLADENNNLKNYTFSKIKDFHWDDEIHFTPKKEFLEQIEKNHTNWFSKESIEVILEVDNEAKDYFLRKEILPNKKILEQTEKHFRVLTQISYDDEILRLVKYWIPYIKIVSPLYLQEKLNKVLEEYLQLK